MSAQQQGIHTSLSVLPNAVPLDSVKHYEDYIARLHQIPRVLTQTTDILRLGMKDNLMPPRFVLEKVAAQASEIATNSPFLNAIKKMPASFSEADRQRLTAAIQQAVTTEVSPAYRAFATFVTNEYAPRGRTSISVSTLPDGKHRYEVAVRQQTTTNMTPAEIHQLGLDEIKRITAEMTDIAHKAGYKDLAAFREAIKNDPKYTPKSEEEILDTFRKYIAQMQPQAPAAQHRPARRPRHLRRSHPPTRPAPPPTTRPAPPTAAAPAASPSAYPTTAHRSLINDEAIAYHEGVPGHHIRLSVQQQPLKRPTPVPPPRRRLHRLHRGWGLYAEQLWQRRHRLLPGPRL